MAGTVVDYGTLKAAIARQLNREDLGSDIPDFIQEAHIILKEYCGFLEDFNLDTDTNLLLQLDPFAYVWGACLNGAAFLEDAEKTAFYGTKFQNVLDRIAISGFPFTVGPLQISPNPVALSNSEDDGLGNITVTYGPLP